MRERDIKKHGNPFAATILIRSMTARNVTLRAYTSIVTNFPGNYDVIRMTCEVWNNVLVYEKSVENLVYFKHKFCICHFEYFAPFERDITVRRLKSI